LCKWIKYFGMIITITLSPALDKSTTFPNLIAEKKIRCTPLVIEAGGGGINVSKVIKALGGESTAVFPAGGGNGKRLMHILEKGGISINPVFAKEETRESFVATDVSVNAQYRFIMPGAALSAAELEQCYQTVRSISPKPSYIVFSGSLPPGVDDSVVAQFAAIAIETGARFIVDTSGIPLKRAVEQGVYLVKPNLSELCSLAEKKYLELDEVESAARLVIKKGHSEVIVVSMGPAGALLVTKDMCKRIPAPTVKKISTVGAGDSMVAGITYMLDQSKPLIEAVQFGVACGTAATMNAGSQLCKKEDVLRLFKWVQSSGS
jgi:6-phosphofructokinase 2